MNTSLSESSLTKKDFKTDQDVRWCPGCGDYAVLNAVQSVVAALGKKREDIVFISGIGCSSRFPYYMNTYGFHTIHGRAPAIATGTKLANPDLDVWVVTGDGDAMSIGGNHLIHALRRRIGIKIMMFNNRIYGLTKGQYSPTSEVGKVTKSTPMGSLDTPFDPIQLVLGAGATFIARSVDIMGPHLQDTLAKAAAHEGGAFVEIFQNCNIFNNRAFERDVARDVREDRLIDLQHGEKMIFGKERDRGIVINQGVPAVVKLADVGENGVQVWDETNPSLTFAMTAMASPEIPTPIGVFRNVPTRSLEAGVHGQIAVATKKSGPGKLKDLIYGGDTWTAE
ncbi:MAG: 2-oxoacid:ferredoxin oxidoreductase subunit beta [Planctomycetota bacterium]